MIFSRRRRKGGGQQGIVEFWAWWATARPRVEAAITARDVEPIAPEMSAGTGHPSGVLHRARGRELGGREAGHALVVSAGGQAELRSLAARWRALAPDGGDGRSPDECQSRIT
ncbi:hypothetical protein AB0M46_28075 [Dactylosporangium sp. NPDC051485]|uniref:hypothetical protein n=1 Tax=Dactylosporangium sp. NPDC051485 TaxID=3154846 RepID=UPI0034284161